jgi:hypothetical protein
MKRRSLLKGFVIAALTPSISFLERVGIIDESSWMVSYVRNFYPMMIVEQLVGVQPMTGPVGEIFTLRYEWNGELDNWGSYII